MEGKIQIFKNINDLLLIKIITIFLFKLIDIYNIIRSVFNFVLFNNLIFNILKIKLLYKEAKKLKNKRRKNKVMNALVGDLLGDGHIRVFNNSNGKGRLEFTFSIMNLPYLRYLKFGIYSELCTQSEPTPWPNPKSGSKNYSILIFNKIFLVSYIKNDIKK